MITLFRRLAAKQQTEQAAHPRGCNNAHPCQALRSPPAQQRSIYYKFVGYLEIPANLSARNYKADLRQGVAVEYVSCEPTDSARELFDEDCEPVEEEQ